MRKQWSKFKQAWLKIYYKNNYLVLFFICIVFLLLRFPSLFEPNWYGDEGIYQTIGHGLRSGRDFYTGVWDNKPPLLFVIYALASGIQFNARLISLFFGLSAVIVFYSLSKKILNGNRSQIIATSFFAAAFALPTLEGNIANSENFMLLPIILSVNLLYPLLCKLDQKLKNRNTFNLLLGGVLLSSSFLIKIVTLFDFAALLVFASLINFYSFKLDFSLILRDIFIFIRKIALFLIGFISPLIISIIYFYFKGTHLLYFDAAFGRNVDYVGWANFFIIPQGLLYIRLLILFIILILLYAKRKIISRPLLFILVWLAFSLFNAFFSNRGYTHYLLLLLPSYSLLVGYIFIRQNNFRKVFSLLTAVLIFLLLFQTFTYWNLNKTFNYYMNFFKLYTGKIDFITYQSFFDSRNPKDYLIADYIKSKTNAKDVVFLWGNSAQIYPMSETLPPGRYSAAYHIINSKETITETEKALNINKPKYIIITPDIISFPFDLSNYDYILTIEDTHIYENKHK